MRKTTIAIFLSLSLFPTVTAFGADAGITGFELYAAGKLGVKQFTKEFIPTDELIIRYVDQVMIPTDQEIRALNEDPTPQPGYQARVNNLRAEKRAQYIEAIRAHYHVAPAPAPITHSAPAKSKTTVTTTETVVLPPTPAVTPPTPEIAAPVAPVAPVASDAPIAPVAPGAPVEPPAPIASTPPPAQASIPSNLSPNAPMNSSLRATSEVEISSKYGQKKPQK